MDYKSALGINPQTGANEVGGETLFEYVNMRLSAAGLPVFGQSKALRAGRYAFESRRYGFGYLNGVRAVFKREVQRHALCALDSRAGKPFQRVFKSVERFAHILLFSRAECDFKHRYRNGGACAESRRAAKPLLDVLDLFAHPLEFVFKGYGKLREFEIIGLACRRVYFPPHLLADEVHLAPDGPALVCSGYKLRYMAF